jgi:CubicO group peptidase (beta-lactamase class C family)
MKINLKSLSLTIILLIPKIYSILSNEEINKRIQKIINNENAPLIGGSLAVIKNNTTLYCDSIGISRLKNESSNKDIKYRTASISKLFTAIAIWQLDEQGKLNVSEDVSKYLNFQLKNPKFNNITITIKMLLSHTSSIRESDSNYNIPLGYNISDFFTNGTEIYYDKAYSEKEPGYFEYVNMNYCLLGTIIENVTNTRFDKYMIENVLKPLNITGSFNIYEMEKEYLDKVGTIYRKLNKKKEFDINGEFIPQMDDFSEGYPKKNFSNYTIGTNGALFGPQGGLRISIEELTHLVYMFLNNGTYNNKTILKKETIDKMLTKIWEYDKSKNNGNTNNDYDLVYLGGPTMIINKGKNRLHKRKRFNFTGHTADAYGLFGGLFFDRIKGYGVVYIGNGDSKNVSQYNPSYSSYNNWALEFIDLADEIAYFDYPFDTNYSMYFIVFAIIAIFIIGCVVGILFYYKDDEKITNEQLI